MKGRLLAAWMIAASTSPAILLPEAPQAPLELEGHSLPGARADIVALILSGRDSGSLAATATAMAEDEPADDDTYRVDVWMEVDGSSLAGAAGSESLRPESLRLELYAYAITPQAEIVASVSRWARVAPAEAAGGVKLGSHFDLARGEYELRLLLRESRSQRFALRILGGSVPAPGAQTSSPAPPVESREALELETQQRASQRVAAIAGAYRGVLELLAAGTAADAVAALRALETETLDSQDERDNAQKWLMAAEEQVIDDLAAVDPECLIPLLLLHVEAHDGYMEDGVKDPYVVNATRERIRGLARLYARKADNDLAPSLVASALAELGVALDRAGLPRNAKSMLDEALDLDDRNVATLLYLAYWHERRSEYQDAAEVLRRSVAAAPRSEEARLRLALNLERADRGDEAEATLEPLIRDGSSEWVLTVAYQELGRILIHDGRAAEAARRLEEGVSRLPAQQRLYLLLAYALDRAGQVRNGGEVAARLPADSGRMSPRMRYSKRPRFAADGAQAALLRHSMARLPLLSAALAATADPR